MDVVVSSYFKAIADHRKEYSLSFRAAARQEGWLSWFFMRRYREFRFVRRRRADFRAYFKRFYWWVYNNRACMLPDNCVIIRFERLQEDFDKAFELLGLRNVRNIPIQHTTEMRERDFAGYYPPALRRRAAFVFGPFLERWGFSFPEDWGTVTIPGLSRVLFQFDSLVRSLYFRRVHFALLGRAEPRS